MYLQIIDTIARKKDCIIWTRFDFQELMRNIWNIFIFVFLNCRYCNLIWTVHLGRFPDLPSYPDNKAEWTIFWPREAKHRGPRSVLVGVVLLLTLLKKVAKNAYNHIYLNYTLFKSDLNVIQHDSDVIQTWFRRGSTWFTWFKENQTLFRGDLLDIQTWIKLDIDGIQRDSTVILWSKRDPNVIQTWIVIQMYI